MCDEAWDDWNCGGSKTSQAGDITGWRGVDEHSLMGEPCLITGLPTIIGCGTRLPFYS